MIPQHVFVADDRVLEFFSDRNHQEREELLRVFRGLADHPYQQGDWQQKTNSGRDLQVKRFGKWLITFWLDEPALEVRILDVKKLVS